MVSILQQQTSNNWHWKPKNISKKANLESAFHGPLREKHHRPTFSPRSSPAKQNFPLALFSLPCPKILPPRLDVDVSEPMLMSETAVESLAIELKLFERDEAADRLLL